MDKKKENKYNLKERTQAIIFLGEYFGAPSLFSPYQ